MRSSLSTELFGSTPGGEATLFTLANSRLRVRITDYGARMVSIEMPDRDGRTGHVLLGFEDAADYVAAGGSFGAILGRFANRIDNGRFALDGHAYQVSVNDRGNTLHGGAAGFSRALWQLETITEGDTPELALTLRSPNGDQGFPGVLAARAVYRLAGDVLRLDLTATTNQPTILNLSAHPYFNLADVSRHDVLSHEITIGAHSFLPTDSRQIPTGERKFVDGTAFDFRKPQAIGARIRQSDPQLLIGRGYDHCFVLNEGGLEGMRFAASARDPISGRMLEVTTTQPGLQFYSGNSLNGAVVGRGGVAFRQSAGFAFEAQNFPDAPNHQEFPSSLLRPGELYHHIIEYRFSAA
jgi:aldose 1-epimerase